MKKFQVLSIFCLLQLNFNQAQEIKVQLHGRLTVSSNKRCLVAEDGKFFFWLGDTGWELFHRLKKEEVIKYFTKRSGQGFNLIQAVVLAEFDGLHIPNAYGEIPLENDDPSKPREAYFSYVDWVIDKAAEYGLYIGLLPTWGDKIFKERWGIGPEIFNVANARAYGEWIGNRYKHKKNLVWILGGDRNPRNETDINIWRSMAEGIAEGVGDIDSALMTFHPQPSETCSSSTWFHNDDWLDFNMLQTGHCEDTKVWEKISGDFNKRVIKPTIIGEAVYEDHPLCFNARENGYTSAYDSRKAAYLSVFAGSFGYTYGCHSIWQFYSPERQGVNGPLRYWYVSMDLPGANQMIYLRKLVESFSLQERMPATNLLIDTLDGSQRIQCTKGKDYLLVYSAAGKPFRVRLGFIDGYMLKAYWFDPRTGAKILSGTIENKGVRRFIPLSEGKENDWVLVLFDVRKKYFEK